MGKCEQAHLNVFNVEFCQYGMM